MKSITIGRVAVILGTSAILAIGSGWPPLSLASTPTARAVGLDQPGGYQGGRHHGSHQFGLHGAGHHGHHFVFHRGRHHRNHRAGEHPGSHYIGAYPGGHYGSYYVGCYVYSHSFYFYYGPQYCYGR